MRVIYEDRRRTLRQINKPRSPASWVYRIEQFYANRWHPFTGSWMSLDDCLDNVDEARHFRSLADIRIVEDET